MREAWQASEAARAMAVVCRGRIGVLSVSAEWEGVVEVPSCNRPNGRAQSRAATRPWRLTCRIRAEMGADSGVRGGQGGVAARLWVEGSAQERDRLLDAGG